MDKKFFITLEICRAADQSCRRGSVVIRKICEKFLPVAKAFLFFINPSLEERIHLCCCRDYRGMPSR